MQAETVVATHGNTDFDALASMLAARRLFPGAVAVVAGSLNRNVREFVRLHEDALELVDAGRIDLDAIRKLVVVETVHASRLDRLEQVARDPDVEKVVFDHHGELPDWAPEEAVFLCEDAALTTSLVGILAERELEPTALEATVFALGIHEDTGSLTFPETTTRDSEALAWCLRHGASQDLVAQYLHTPLMREERELLTALLDRIEPRTVAGIEVLVAAVRWKAVDVSVSHLATKLAELTDAKALVCLVELNDRVFVVTRSRVPEIDAAAVAGVLGGGGHAQAASAAFKGTLDEALAALDLEPGAREPIRAREVMASPPRTVSPDDSVADAMVVCQRHGMSGALVVDAGGRLAGVVAREDLDKAIGHGLSHAPVKGVMGGRDQVPVADEQTPLPELQHLLAHARAGRVAICRDDRLVGVVTRSDVLRALGTPTADAALPGESLRAELEAIERLAPVFAAVQAVAEHADGVYLVGGTVRDILLGEAGFDVDIAVEGDAIALAGALAAELDGRVRPHEKFGTAVVVYGADEQHVDVVTARTEFYASPAALPSVEHASIREDLFRRDFTVNAMAVALKGADYGRLVDPFGGRGDLERGAIRVLHNLSFIDDPTRIFRAIRYENRYGFRMEPHTEGLARACVELGLVGDLSTARLRDELVALLSEGSVRHTILRLADLGADRAIHPHLAADAEAVDLLERLTALRDEYGLDVPDWRLGLEALARSMPPEEIYGWAERLKLRRRDAEAIAGAVTVAPRLVERLGAQELAPADVVALAEPYAPDAPLLALALADLPQLRDYFARLHAVQLEIGGGDLAELGLAESPRVGEILAEVRRRKLNGELPGRDAELAAARDLIAAGRDGFDTSGTESAHRRTE